jgi:redox-sensitive bicupin YhaK (pirin superfamily)
VFADPAGKKTEVTIVAGSLAETRAPSPPPRSWASRADTDVAIWCVRMEPGATWTLPRAARGDAARALYFFAGDSLRVGDDTLRSHCAAMLRSDVDAELEAGAAACEVLVLQGRPIGEPIAQHGPFVMNTREEIQRAMADYRRTRFGGWPWPSDDPVHAREEGRFARHADGRIERADSPPGAGE